MNKIIFTTERGFISVVGPSGSGKTRLMFSMLTSQTFYPRFQKIYYFYREFQQIFKEVEKRMNIEFISSINFDLLMIFDDSCEEKNLPR